MFRISKHRWCVPFLLLVWSALLFFPGLTSGELWRTEGLRGRIAQEALQSGNWLVPTLYGHPLLTKPPGMYVAVALVSWPAGEVTQWSARLPSARALPGSSGSGLPLRCAVCVSAAGSFHTTMLFTA